MMSLSERLRPASAKQGNTELLSCLILVAPSGMTAEDRDAWLRAAKMTLSGMPADLLSFGCKKARESCRFASEIVPTIMETVGASWEQRKEFARNQALAEANKSAPRLERPRNEYWRPVKGETQRILQQVRAEIDREG
jgi:hypothetical protein